VNLPVWVLYVDAAVAAGLLLVAWLLSLVRRRRRRLRYRRWVAEQERKRVLQ
jgi:hypothetical protein